MRPITLLALSSSYLFASVRAQDRSTEQGEAQIKDPNVECAYTPYPPVEQNLKSFPTSWDAAKIVAGDTEAQDKFNSIKDSIPNISPKGTITGDFSNFTSTYSPSDPDCWWTYKQCLGSGDVAVVPEPNTLGFGFDDGPNCSHNAFYDFFATEPTESHNVINHPLEAQRGLADGHEICVHTWSHHYMTAFSNEDAFAELWYSKSASPMKIIKLVTGVTPTCWRPPFGDVDNRIRAIAKGIGLDTWIWTYDSEDWKVAAGQATVEQVDGNYQGLINDAKSGKFSQAGTIILQHEIDNFTMSKAVQWYPQMKAAFKQLVPVGVALNRTHPYVETNYTQNAFGSSSGSSGPSASPSSSGANAGKTTVSNTSNGAMDAFKIPTFPLAFTVFTFFSALIV